MVRPCIEGKWKNNQTSNRKKNYKQMTLRKALNKIKDIVEKTQKLSMKMCRGCVRQGLMKRYRDRAIIPIKQEN